MKRDLDLIRDILLEIEKSYRSLKVSDICIPERTSAEILFHVELLADADYIEYSSVKTFNSVNYAVHRLTMKGCDYLDSIRNDQIWKDACTKVFRTVGTAPLDIIKDVALSIIKHRLDL